jgi:hypothetical protein
MTGKAGAHAQYPQNQDFVPVSLTSAASIRRAARRKPL